LPELLLQRPQGAKVIGFAPETLEINEFSDHNGSVGIAHPNAVRCPFAPALMIRRGRDNVTRLDSCELSTHHDRSDDNSRECERTGNDALEHRDIHDGSEIHMM
jgi:hypothetical protein